MLKEIQLDQKVYTFDLEAEQDQIKYALGMAAKIPSHMEARHWALEHEWRDELVDRFEYKRREALESLLILCEIK